MNDNLKNLYNTLLNNGYAPPSFEQFEKDMQDEKNLRGVYSTLQKEGFTPPSFDQFKKDMGYVVPQPQQPVQQPVSKPTQQPVQQQVRAGGGVFGGMQKRVDHAVESLKNIAAIAPSPATSADEATPQTRQPKQEEQPQKQGGWQPTWQEKMGMQMQLDDMTQRMEQSRKEQAKRMENMQKGTSIGRQSERIFNPETGKFEQKFYTTTGEEVDSWAEQSRINMAERDRWERDTEEGQASHKKRIENAFERRVETSLDKYDPENAAEMVWQQAEESLARANEQMSSTYGMIPQASTARAINTTANSLKYHDLQRMADDAWNMLGSEKQQSIIEDMYGALKSRYPQATEEQLQQAATEMAREQSDRRMYELAVAKNAPKDATEYFIRKVAAGNMVGTLMQAAARAQAGTTGDWEAREDAEQRFEKQGHKVAGIGGTVAGFALDPLTWISAGLSSAAVKGATWAAGRYAGEAAVREFSTSLTGRLAAGVLGSAVNFGTYMAGSEALDQMKWGGYIDEETGERKDGFSLGRVAGRAVHGLMMGSVTGMVAPFLGNVSDKLVRATESTVGKVGIRAGELGVGTVAEGTIFAVPEIIDTYGQYGEHINSLSDENSPKYIADEQERAAKIEELRNSRGDAMMDVWTDNMAMIAGFKTQHLIKSSIRTIGELAASRKGKAGFETRLRTILDGRPELALTEDEKQELERGGYRDLKELTEDYQRYVKQQAAEKGGRPISSPERQIADELPENVSRDLPYNRFSELMSDKSISEAARAKMYYYITGHSLPMSTVMGSNVIENRDADGNVKSYTVESFGANGVITSRTFGDKKRADVEVNRINRQAELNGFDVGERYYEADGDKKRMEQACKNVSREISGQYFGFGSNARLWQRLYDLIKKKPEEMNEEELDLSKRILDEYNHLGNKFAYERYKYGANGDIEEIITEEVIADTKGVRAAVNEEFGVDVDKAIRKEPVRRSEQEQKAVEEYASRLFEDIRQAQEEARRKQEEDASRRAGDHTDGTPQGEGPAGTGGPSGPDVPPTMGRIAGLLGIKDDTPDDGMTEAQRRGYDANADERRDIAIEVALATQQTGPVNAEAQEAWNGVVQRINADAAYMAAQERERAKKIQHTDGSFRPATLKEKDSEGGDQQVYIVDGIVEMMADGEMVDPSKSDQTVVVVNPATGERKMIDPTADSGISSLGEVTTAEQREAEIERGREEYVRTQIDEAQGTVRLAPGDQLIMPTGEEAVVVATDANGENVTVRLGDGTQTTVQRSELQRIRDEKAVADYRQRHGITEESAAQQSAASTPAQPQADGRVAGAPAEYAVDMELSIRDDDGEVKPAIVMGRVKFENGQFIPSSDGNIIEYLMNGLVLHENIDRLNESVVSHVPLEEAPVQTENQTEGPGVNATNKPSGLETVRNRFGDSLQPDAEGEKAMAEARQQDERRDAERQRGIAANQSAFTRRAAEGIWNSAADAGTGAVPRIIGDQMEYLSGRARAEQEERERQRLERERNREEESRKMPMVEVNGKMKPDWSKATPARTHTYLYNERGLSRENADAFVENSRKAAEDEIKKHLKRRPKIGTDIDEFEAQTAEWQGKLEALQRQHDYWQAVQTIGAEAAQAPGKIVDDAAEAMPTVKDADGGERPAWERSTPSRGLTYMQDEMQLSDAEVADFIRNNSQRADKALLEHNKTKPTSQKESDPAAYKRKKDTWEKKRDELRRASEYWNEMREERKRRIRQAAEEKERLRREALTADERAAEDAERARVEAEQRRRQQEASERARREQEAREVTARRRREEAYQRRVEALKRKYGEHFDSDTDVPHSVEELIAMNLPTGISWESIQREVGRGFSRGRGGDIAMLSPYIAKDGRLTFDEAVHAIWEGEENVLADGGTRWEIDEVRNALIGFLQDVKSVKDIRDYVLDRREEEARASLAADEAAEEAARDEWFMERYDLTYEEYSGFIRQLGEEYARAEGYYDSEEFFNEIENERKRQEGAGSVEGAGAAEGVGPSSDAEGVERPADGRGTTRNAYTRGHERGSEGTAPLISTSEWNGHKTGDRYLQADGETSEIIGFDYTYSGESGTPEVLVRSYDKNGNLTGTDALPGLMFDEEVRNGSMRKIEASEQLKPADLRDKLKPDSKKLGEGKGENEEPKPIGKNRFGGIFNQFKGMVKEAFDFLVKKKDGYLQAVFHRDDLGDIDLAWGSAPTDFTGKGLAHIIRKHIEVMKDFENLDEAMRIIDDVINTGEAKQDKKDPQLVNIEKGNYRVVVAKNAEGNWILSAFDYVTSKKEKIKGKTLPPSKTPGQSDVKAGAVASNLSIGKDNTSSSNLQGKGEKNAENQTPIQGLDGYTEDEVLSLVRGDIEEKLADAGIDGVTIKGMALHGSRLRGDAREDSDLDVVVEYEGDMSEDGLFNILNDEPMEIEGVRVDVNPITRGKSGTLDQYMARSRQYDALRKAERETDTEPTEAQKEAGNYKKGHVKIDGYDVTIENPKGSVRRGTDASGKQWEQQMQNTYGYIRGTEGVDGDHIDVFFSDDPSQGDVFVVDQVNKDGSFDEHKVMYGFPDIESARKAYLSNYEDGWTGLGAITPVSKEEFKKWINSSHRKTKPFAEYSSVKPLGDTGHGEQRRQEERRMAGRRPNSVAVAGREHEVKRTVAHFAEETADEAAAFDKRVPEMDDAELLAYMQEDGRGDVNKAHHPSVYDEYDYRHGDEQLQSYDDTLVRLNENGTTLEQAEEMLANIQKDVSRLATEDRAMLLGQEDALQEYIAGLEKIVPGHDLQEHIDTLAALQDNGKDYNENAYDAYAAGRRFGNGVNKELTKKEAIALAHKMVGENHARGGVYILPFLDGVGDSVDLRSGEISDEAGTQKKKYVSMRKYQAKKSGLPNEAEASTLGSSAKISSADSESPVATNKSLAGSATSVSAGKGTDLFGNEQGKVKKSSSETKIDDVGEVLAGARKDMRKEIAKSLANVTEAALVEKPFGKVYKKPDLKKAVESGALREKDAIFYDALFSQVNQQKPKVTQSEVRSKRYIPGYKTKAERWASDTFKQMEVLRQFMELDEAGRDAMMDQLLADRYPTRDQELAEIEKRKGWNPDYEGHKYEWGDKTTPNPLWVTYEIMNRLGYNVGDKLDVPYGVVKANTSGTGYTIENLKGDRASIFGNGMTLDEAIDTAVYLARLKRGDADVSHPTHLFVFPHTKSEYGESGRYRVMWGRDYKTREFDSKEEADAFAQTKKGAFVSPINEVKRRFGYKVQFYHPLTGERIFVDDAEFDTKADAQAYFDGNFEKINDATNARLQAEREKKGERKTLKADDVVHVTMVHSSQGGWTHAVVIDKKYANNDGMVRIIKEGFASRKDAEAFAGSIKDEVLKTVLKHKEEAKKIVYFDTGENSRIGEDYRNGKDVDAEDFMNTFGFRGVQFGNWTNQADRQMAVNQAYDAFMDMARLIGVSPKAMSLNGELGIAFGARGVGGFAAHYEPGEVVINLTKTQGAGSLAHEWWHALDNYFARRAGSAGDMVTDNRRIEMRDALRKAFNDMLDMVNGSDYAQRSTAKGEYWGRTHEITARLLAEWVDRELKKRGELNTFLSRGAVVERGQQHNYNVYEVLERLAGREPMPFEDYKELPESLKGIPYPSVKEVEQFGASLRHIFDTLEERVDEETGNVMVYEQSSGYRSKDGTRITYLSLFDEMEMSGETDAAKTSHHTGQEGNGVIVPSDIRLRKLRKGETCHVERVYEETKQFDFTGKEKVESAEDVAYIFRQLENAAVENSFLVLVKDGRPTVIHLGVGSYVNVMAPYEQALVAYRELKPEQVYFVHNHPSGVLKASRQDQELLKRVKMAFGEDVVQQGIIIDTTSGKYGEFDMVVDNYDLVQTSGVEAMPQSEGADVPIKVYQFSRQVFAPDWNPESAFKIVSSQSVAEFVSSHRLGEHKKMSFLVVNNSGNVVANVFLPWTKLSDIKRSKDAGDLLAGYVHQCGGVRGVLYGNYDYEPDDRAVLAAVGGRMRQLNAPLMDALHVEHSAYENGWAGVGEPKEGYGVDATPFHNIIDEMFGNEDFDKSAHARERYDLGATPEWMKGIGISGERFTLSFKNIKTHLGKDADHNLTAKEWHELPSALKHPFLVTSYGNKDGKFRLYTTIKVGDKFAVVGVDVVRINQGKGVPMLELNRIKTVFGRDRYVVENGERILAWDKNITPEQEALLRGHNYREYPTIQELSAAKIGNNSDIAKENGENVVEDTAKYRIREDEPPTKTGIGYKVFVLKDGKLYPPMVANPNGEATPVGVWLDADAAPVAGVTKTGRQQVKAGGKGTQGGSGKLAYRPGWHLGEIPYALQFNRMNPETGQRELFPANFVWAEVEYANDVDYQEEAMSYGMNASGKFQHSLAGLPRLPENGSYRYRTNPDPNTDPWVITGAMKVNRILKPSEVDAMVEAAGREPQQRQAGAITDEQVEALNAKVKRTMQEDRDMMRSAVQQMGEKLHTDINIIEDVNEITHPNAAVQERRRRSKGWYDTATGQVNIVLPNNRNIDDVKASVGHETIAHKGLRELVGEENYDEFLDETYQHLRDDLKKGVDDAAGKMFLAAMTSQHTGRTYERCRREAVDELFGRMAEKPFEEFSEGERTLWQRIKATVRRLLDKFLGSLKLPKWFELGDNELRYILWRSKERLERGKEHPIDLARDIVKREELGLTDEARYNMGDVAEPSFAARRDRAVKEHGYVHPGLNSAEVKVVSIKEKSPFDTSKKTKALKEDVVAYANEHNIIGTMTEEETKGKGKVTISKASIEKMVDDSATGKSVDKDTHLAIIPQLREVIAESIMAETHPDYNKGKDGKRSPENGHSGNVLIHRCYGAINIDGMDYRVKITLKEDGSHKGAPHKAYTYEVTKIELLGSTDGEGVPSTSYTSNSESIPTRLQTSDDAQAVQREVYLSTAKLLQNVEKSHDLGKKLLEQSEIADESTDLYRDPDETEDIWKDRSLGLQERITAAATRLASNHREDKTLRSDAMRAICDNLADLAKSMLGHPRKKDLTDAERRSVNAKAGDAARAQKRFDQTTVKRVSDLARVLISSGHLNGLSAGEVKRLLSAVKNSAGHDDIEGDVQKVMDIMVDNQLKQGESTLHELEAIRGSKVDARGVEVQGELDPAGAHTMKVFKKTRGWEKTDIEEAISEAQQRMGSSDVAVADEAALEYTGLQLALEYAENIKDSKVEERKLREEIKQAHDDASERDRDTDSYRQYIASLQEAIRQNKIERAQSYFDLVGRLSDSLRESIANAKDFKEAEKQRIREIQHNANSDMEGRPSDEHYKPTFADKFVNNSFVSFLFAPLATFDQMLRMFGGKSANGEGYLYNRFMRGWIDARQKEINGVRDKYAILDAKAAELFGGKVKTWGDLIRRVGKLPKGTVSFWNGGEMQERELTQGNLMYIYMVNKMLDGRMKLRKMGITEENVADIEEVLDPRLTALADWLQDEFLVQTRNEYNETHKRMFGASMAAIEHYFPLKILANARADKPEDLDNPDKSDGISTATGSIIKRRRNALALDITGADALSVILDHVAQMEHWNAFAEFNRDINTLRTYKRFRNQVQNMTTIYGSGKELWKKFNDVCQMAAGTYRPPRTKLDEAAVNFAKGVTAAKVSFRMFTALKQFLSMPAYIPEARTDYLLRNIANPVGAWKWSMEHLPIFSERWRSRMSGDPRLLKSDMDWKMWRTRIMQLASRVGMSPNAFVDALTVSIGAHSMYQTRLAQYLRDGYSEADAEKKAVQDAEVLYNQTQQSSEGAFTSTMQVDRSWLSVLFTVFRNASMSYQRQLHDALRNFKHNLTQGGRARSIEFMTKQLLRDKGIEPQTDGNWSDADWQREEQVAKRKFRRQLLKDTLRVATFGYIMQFAWNLGAYLPYLLFGDDEDEKQKMWDDVWAHTAFGSVEGLTGGDLMSQAGQMMLTGEGNPAYLSKDMPLTSDIMAAFQKLGNGQHTEALNDMINLIVQAGLGVNPQSITDVALSIMDACGDDPTLAHEATICISRILQVPQSQIDKMYFDEVGLSGDEVSKYTPAQLAERYAEFKVKRGRFFSPWSWDDEERIGKFTDKANKTIKERTEQMGDKEVNESYDRHAEAFKEMDVRVKDLKKSIKEAGSDVERQMLLEDIQHYMAGDTGRFYGLFKTYDEGLGDLAKMYLSAKTPDEATLCRQAVLDYKAAMVKVLDAPDEDARAEAIGDLGNVMREFAEKYAPMQQPNR